MLVDLWDYIFQIWLTVCYLKQNFLISNWFPTSYPNLLYHSAELFA